MWVLLAGNAVAKNYLSATIVTESGVISTDKLIAGKEQFEKGVAIDVLVNGVETASKIPFDLIREFVLSDVYKDKINGSLILKNGKRIEFRDIYKSRLFGNKYLVYEIPDPITGKPSTQSMTFMKVKTISLNAVNGMFMIDSKGRVWPPDYQFSPYTGEKLSPQRN